MKQQAPGEGPTGTGHVRASARLAQVLETHRGERHMIAIRGYPDPDSIGAAMAHAHICAHFGIESMILYFDDISHQENRALVKKLEIQMVRYTPGLDLEGFHRIAIVDTPRIELPSEVGRMPFVSVVDHHKSQDFDAEFKDVREDAGSTCSIYAEYLEDGIAPLERDDASSGHIASAMLYGIRTDSDDFQLAREIDFRAAAFLVPYADRDLLLSISMQKISPRTMEVTQRAYANKVIVDTFLISGVEYVRDEDRDSIGQAAEYLLLREGIDTVLCYGIVNNSFVDGSLRTRSSTVDPDRFIKDLLGADANGNFYGGGRTDKGAFKIPLGPFSHCGDKDILWRMVQRTIEDLFLQRVGTNRG
jgi:nanoRNase/pAp phosphatase (c-di-AMP/oligoRNAs hydrolase)